MQKSGFIALIGRPNTGKSTLMNRICGKKIAIVSHIPQTTRNTIKGIYTKDDCQAVFLDTPGLHESARAYNKILNKQAEGAIEEADMVLYLLDISRPFGKEEEVILEMLKKQKKPIHVAYNKVDIKDNHVVQNSMIYKEKLKELPQVKEHYISALKDHNVDEMVEDLCAELPEHPFLYPEDMTTDQALEFLVSETIREKAMLSVHKEIPHSIQVEVQDIDDETNPKVVHVYADLLVERESQKGILIGKGGSMLVKIGKKAREELEGMFGRKVYLELSVKVQKGWKVGR